MLSQLWIGFHKWAKRLIFSQKYHHPIAALLWWWFHLLRKQTGVVARLPTAASVRHYNDVIMNAMASQIISLTIVYSILYSGADQRKPKSSASLAFVWGIHRWQVITQRASNAESVPIWWRHHVFFHTTNLSHSFRSTTNWEKQVEPAGWCPTKQPLGGITKLISSVPPIYSLFYDTVLS